MERTWSWSVTGRRGQRHEGPASGGVDGGEEAGPAARGEELPVGVLFWWYGEDVSYAPHQDIAALGVVTLAELEPWA